MSTRRTRVFKSGNSMAVRLPKHIHLQGPDVEIEQQGNSIIIREIPKNLANAFSLLGQLSDDFLSEERHDPPPQKREFPE